MTRFVLHPMLEIAMVIIAMNFINRMTVCLKECYIALNSSYSFLFRFVDFAKVNKISNTTKKIPENLFVGNASVCLSLDVPSLLQGSKSDVNTI